MRSPPLSVVYPTARGTGPVLTMLVAVLFLGERPGWVAAVGALVIVLGIVVTASGPRSALPSPPGEDAGPSPLVAGLVWGAGTGLFIAGYTLWDDHSVTALALAPIPYFAMSSVYQAVIASAQLTPARRAVLGRTLRANVWPILAIAAFSPAAYVLVLIAMQTQPVSLVAPLRETSIVIGSLLGWLIFKEAHPARRLLGAAVVLGGVALIS
ncbi:DMT family transporter, partial [Rothia kristinae]